MKLTSTGEVYTPARMELMLCCTKEPVQMQPVEIASMQCGAEGDVFDAQKRYFDSSYMSHVL